MRITNLFITLICFTLFACEIDKASGSDNNTDNVTPTTSAGNDQTVNEQINVSLDASASSDSDGSISSFQWSQVSGTSVLLNNANTATASFTAPAVTTTEVLVFKVTVTDNDNGTSTDNVSITVNDVANADPVANAGGDQTVNEQVTVTLNGRLSSDSDGTIDAFLWKQTSGANVTLINPTTDTASFTGPTISTTAILKFSLKVTDNDGATNLTTVTITVDAINIPPVSVAGNDETVTEADTVNLSGSSSADNDGTIASYLWAAPGGSNIVLTSTNTENTSFVAPLMNTELVYELSLQVTDNEGASHTDFVNITIKPKPRTLSGTVKNINDESAIAGATITLSDGTTGTTNTQGEFTITGLPVVEYSTVIASNSSNYTSKTLKYIQSDKTGLVFKLVPIATVDVGTANGCTLSGKITDADTQLPVANVDVFLRHPGVDNIGNTSDDIEVFAATNSTGDYQFINLTVLTNHHYSYGALVGKRRDNRNKEYEGNSHRNFRCETSNAAFVKDISLSKVVANTKITGKLLDSSGNALTKAFKVEVHRMHSGAIANCNDCSNWIDASIILDTSNDSFINYNQSTGDFEITELAGNGIYDLQLGSLFYSGFRTFHDFTTYNTTVTAGGPLPLNMGTITVTDDTKVDHKLLTPSDANVLSTNSLNFTWENAPSGLGINSLLFVIYEKAGTVISTDGTNAVLPIESDLNIKFSVRLASTVTSLTLDAGTTPITSERMEMGGANSLKVDTEYYWGIFGVTPAVSSTGLFHNLTANTISFQELGLRKFTKTNVAP